MRESLRYTMLPEMVISEQSYKKYRKKSIYSFSSSGRDESVNFLIDRGANVNSTNNNGSTPLHEATQNGNPEIITQEIQTKSSNSFPYLRRS